MRIINNTDVIEKSAMQGEISRLAIALIGYLFITSIISLIIIFITGADINGIVHLIASLLGLAFISFMYRGDLDIGDLFEDTREIPPMVFLNAMVVVIGIQPVFQLISQGLEQIALGFNYELMFSTIDKSAKGSFFIMFNLVIVSPFIEEMIFRGLLLRSLAEYGRNFAIITTSILFGMYHTSLIENGYAFVAGIALAYITLRYSIKWAIIIHCSNNMLMMLIAFMDIPFQLNYIFLGIFFVWGLVILIIKRKKLYRYYDKGRSKKNSYRYTFTDYYLLAFLALTVILTILDVKLISIYE